MTDSVMSILSHTFLLLVIFLTTTYAKPVDTQSDDLRQYLRSIDDKVRTLMSMVSEKRALPPIPPKKISSKDLPNVHPWRSLDESNYGQMDEWEEKLLARHRLQQQQQEESAYSNDQQILKQISREVDKITLLVKSLNHPVSIVTPERQDFDAQSQSRNQDLRELLLDLDRTLRKVEQLQSSKDQEDKPVAPSSTEDTGEQELMNLLAENSKQGTNQAEKAKPVADGGKDTDQTTASTQPNLGENMEPPAEDKEGIRKSLSQLMADMKDLESKVKTSNQQSEAKLLHERLLQLAEKLGNPPR